MKAVLRRVALVKTDVSEEFNVNIIRVTSCHIDDAALLRRVALVRTDVSEELSAYIIRVTSCHIDEGSVAPCGSCKNRSFGGT
jgi:DNA-binding TFAR19-related protein (PDSD5 family)